MFVEMRINVFAALGFFQELSCVNEQFFAPIHCLNAKSLNLVVVWTCSECIHERIGQIHLLHPNSVVAYKEQW